MALSDWLRVLQWVALLSLQPLRTLILWQGSTVALMKLPNGMAQLGPVRQTMLGVVVLAVVYPTPPCINERRHRVVVPQLNVMMLMIYSSLGGAIVLKRRSGLPIQ